ncbi:hypothetical protein P0136_09240 [Lentisphaerota bacterium ZTH]|nr:hypothetical protein JYG24_13250 [Lentisphaerota bacterium]WET05547.1 hypothetical protein P0136_09240 [Lentisphaerota bacterium ZTH]
MDECPACQSGGKSVPLESVKNKITELFDELLLHDGFGNLEVDMRILKRGQKEILVRCGKEYRFVVDFQARKPLGKYSNKREGGS